MKTSLPELLRASAESRRYPFLDRADFWEERLMMHLKDLEVVLDAPVAGDMLTLPPKAKLEVVPPPATPVVPASRTDDLAFAPAGEIAARVRRRDLSPFEVARAFVERADTIAPSMPSLPCGRKLFCARRANSRRGCRRVRIWDLSPVCRWQSRT